MAKVFYVGFNGYGQYPKSENISCDVITEWDSIELEEFINISCTHKFIIIESKDKFRIYGMTGIEKCGDIIKKIFEIDNFESNDDYMIVSQGINLWKYDYENVSWEKLELNFAYPEEEVIWERDTGIRKFSFRADISDVILLTNSGNVWLLSKENRLQLIFLFDVEKAIDIASGLAHTLILTESGCVLSFGNSRGQLGHGNLEATSQLVQIEALEGMKITKIAAGGWHSAAITDTGGLYVWGWNKHGQLSVFEGDEEIGLAHLPLFVQVGADEDIDVVDVACGNRHTIAKLENGDLYATGWNLYSQLGVQSPASQISKFTKSTIVKNENRRLLCGPWYTILLEDLPEKLV